jgi:hypothetical protein
MKKIAIVQSNYIPWIGYFDLLKTVDEFVLFDDVQYTKRDWRNRNNIKTPDGVFKLTIPVLTKGNFYQKINETKISNSEWSKSHWETIRVNYKRSKYFDEISSWLKPLYLSSNSESLSETNYIFIKGICSYLEINTIITRSSDYNIIEGKTERLADICTQANADEYVSGPAAKIYIDEKIFKELHIKLSWFEYPEYKKYDQLWGGFEKNLSIIDLLFNHGPQSINYI